MTEAMLRFSLGLAGSVLVGVAVFRGHVLHPGHPAFECVTIGALTAGVLTLVRTAHAGPAFALLLAFGGLRFVLTPVVRFGAAASGLLLGLGLFLVALIFDLLAKAGWRFGKFLLVGPLVGGVFLALAPITEMQHMHVLNAARLMMFRLALGMLIGESVAFGIEAAELALSRSARATPAAAGPPPPVPVAPADRDGR